VTSDGIWRKARDVANRKKKKRNEKKKRPTTKARSTTYVAKKKTIKRSGIHEEGKKGRKKLPDRKTWKKEKMEEALNQYKGRTTRGERGEKNKDFSDLGKTVEDQKLLETKDNLILVN